MLDETGRADLRKEVLLSFHRQFAENQRNREQSFLKLLAILAGAVAGYALLYRERLVGSPNALPVHIVVLFHIVATVLLVAGTLLIITISRDFRRDQAVTAKIRRECDLLGDEKIFPSSYDPAVGLQQWGLYEWMPDFLLIFYLLFVFFQGVGYAALLIVSGAGLEIRDPDWWITTGAVFSLLSVLSSLFFWPALYRRKLTKVLRLKTSECGLRVVYSRWWHRASAAGAASAVQVKATGPAAQS